MAALIESLIGHSKQKEVLLSMARQQSLPSTFIFYGPEGIGKKQLAHALLQILNCQRDVQACGQCNSCLRVNEEKNEFVYHLGLQDKKNISIDQVRDLHKFLSLKTMSPARFVIVDPADKLSLSAANALLKALEEAPEDTYFFLITDRLSALLPTIRSRSQILRFNPLADRELDQLENVDEVARQWCGGRVDMAEHLSDEESIEYLNQSLQFLYALLSPQPQDWKKDFAWFFSQDSWREFCFFIWQRALEQRLQGRSENLEWLPLESDALSSMFEASEELQRDVARNVDKVLAIENFYYSLRRRVLGEETQWS
ncbi:MAG: DNA polymerase III subunit [Bdellovibrionales bacterium]|nr:DNA polymerase III subunit [Bdellovibrionales bacterium]